MVDGVNVGAAGEELANLLGELAVEGTFPQRTGDKGDALHGRFFLFGRRGARLQNTGAHHPPPSSYPRTRNTAAAPRNITPGTYDIIPEVCRKCEE